MKISTLALVCVVLAGCSSGPAGGGETVAKTSEPLKSESTPSPGDSATTKDNGGTKPSDTTKANPINPDATKHDATKPGAPKRPAPLKNDIPLANQEGWTLDATKPKDLAKFVDSQLNEMRSVLASIRVAFDVPAGRASGEAVLYVKNNKTWRFQHPMIVNDDRGATYEIVVADGTKFARIGDAGWSEPAAVGSRKEFTGPDLIKRWPQEAMSLAFSGVGNDTKPWSSYIAEVSKPGSGFQVRVDRRTITFDGKRNEQQRFLVERDPASARKLGILVVELVVDKRFGLPMSIRSAIHSPGKKTSIINWSAEWRAQKEFDAEMFKTPLHATKAQKTSSGN